MATNIELAHATASATLAPKPTAAGVAMRFVRTKPLGAAGAVIILGMLALAVFAELLAPYDPYVGDYGLQFARPSAEHWFGTDEFGRDVLSRIMYGARIALFVGFFASFIGCTLGAVSFVIIVVMMFAGVFSGLVSPYNPLDIDFASILAPPSWDHWGGTDAFGRDILSRIIWGSRTALVIGFTSSFLGSSIGAVLGVASAYFGGKIDDWIQRFVDILLAFPIIVLALVVVAALRKSVLFGIDMNLIYAIAIPIIPRVARVVRAAALSVRVMPYVDAARAAGYSNSRIIFRHMAPNVVAPYLIMFTAFIAQAILLEASLSFLGLGVTEPTPAWGLMLSGNAADFYREAPWMILFPGAAISLAVFAFNLFGDSLRDYLDPRFKT